MEKLVIKKDEVLVDEIELDKTLFTIGRDAESDLQLNDPSVSRHHATVRRIYTDLYIEDMGSTNGTILNGRTVTKHVLKPGDHLSIGSYVIDLVQEQTAEEDDLDKTVVIEPAAVAAARSKSVSGAPRKLLPKSATLRFFRGPTRPNRTDRTLALHDRKAGRERGGDRPPAPGFLPAAHWWLQLPANQRQGDRFTGWGAAAGG